MEKREKGGKEKREKKDGRQIGREGERQRKEMKRKPISHFNLKSTSPNPYHF